MSETETNIRAGEVVLLSHGCYSDYGYVGFLVFRRDADLEALADEYVRSVIQATPDLEDSNADLEQGFPAWLVVEGHAAPFDSREIHIGNYFSLEIGRVNAHGWSLDEYEPLAGTETSS